VPQLQLPETTGGRSPPRPSGGTYCAEQPPNGFIGRNWKGGKGKGEGGTGKEKGGRKRRG